MKNEKVLLSIMGQDQMDAGISFLWEATDNSRTFVKNNFDSCGDHIWEV